MKVCLLSVVLVVLVCLSTMEAPLSETKGNRSMKEFNKALLSLILKTQWKDIMIINDYEEAINILIRFLHKSGIITTIIEAEHVKNYQNFSSRVKFIREFEGYVLITASKSGIQKLVPELKHKRSINARKKWIFAVDSQISSAVNDMYLEEGDNVLLLKKSMNAEPHLALTEFCQLAVNISKINLSANQEKFSIFSLYSVGNGDIVFCKKGYWYLNLQVDNNLFYPPFTNFHNRVLRVTSLGYYPIRLRPQGSDQRWRGWIFEAVNALADLFNFSYTVSDPPDKTYGMPFDEAKQNWSGLIGVLIKKNADIAAADISISPDRSHAVDFTTAIFEESLTFVYTTPSFLTRAWILFEPYDKKVWIAVFITGVILAMMIFILAALDVFISKREDRNLYDMLYLSVENSFRIMLSQGSDRPPTFSSGRVMVSAGLLCVLVLAAIYSGNLTYSLTFHKTEPPYDNLRKMVASYPRIKLTVSEGSLPHGYFMEDTRIYTEIWKNNIKDNVLPAGVDQNEIIELVKNSSYVWIYERTMLERMVRLTSGKEGICEFYVAKDNILHTDWALALQKNSPFLSQFNERIRWMRYYGLPGRWKDKYWETRKQPCQQSDGFNRKELMEVTLDDTEAIFILLAGGLLVSFILFLMELLAFHWRDLQCKSKWHCLFESLARNQNEKANSKIQSVELVDNTLPNCQTTVLNRPS